MAIELLDFGADNNMAAEIKVIGVGGGGGNAVNYMFQKGIAGVGFVICNTDSQAIRNSPVPLAVQLGESLTQGRGAGNMPEMGEKAAIENIDQVRTILMENTHMVFITACMGGGTGTGAAPVIAKLAHDMKILTIAVVTIPSKAEGRKRYEQALEGVEKIKEQVDSLLVINNEKIRQIYGNLPASQAFSKADEILAKAVKGVAEIITLHGNINIDFADVRTVMAESKVFIMGTGYAEGENRALVATEAALESPLLDSNDIFGTREILLNITSCHDEITIGEIGEIIAYLQEKAGSGANIIWGNGYDPDLENKICVTIIATGFKTNPSEVLQQQEKLPEEHVLLVMDEEPVYLHEAHKPETEQPTFMDSPRKMAAPVASSTKKNHEKKRERPKEKETKIDNWFMRQFNSLFDEEGIDLNNDK
jgi:cell division protein FtsZ